MGEFIGDKSVERERRKEPVKKAEPKRETSPKNEAEPLRKTSTSRAQTGSSKSAPAKSKSYSSPQKSSSKSRSASSSSKSTSAKSSSSKSGSSKSTSSKSRSASSSYTKTSSAPKKSTKSASESVNKDYDRYERDLHSTAYAKQLSRDRQIKAYRRNSALRTFLMYAAIAAAVIAVTIILSTTILFNIETIDVEIVGELPYTQEEILAKSGLQLGQNMFTPTVFSVADSLEENMPYIEDCKLRRKLPSGITIVAEAANILGILDTDDGRSYVVSTSGRALELVTIETNTTGITKVEGIILNENTAVGSAVSVDDPSRLEVVTQLSELFAGQEMKLDSISFDASDSLYATYDSRIEFVFGLPTNLKSKVLLAATLINGGKIAQIESGRLNLSIDGEATFTPDYILAQYEKDADSSDE